MYDELVKRLRASAIMSEALSIFLPHSEGSAVAKLHNEAADAIEELSRVAEAIPHRCECCVGCELEKKNGGCDHAFVLSPKRAMQYLSKPRWIPTAERCPEKSGDYLVFDDCRNLYVNEWHCLLKKWQYDDSRITHWMPLPTPPKEESYGI